MQLLDEEVPYPHAATTQLHAPIAPQNKKDVTIPPLVPLSSASALFSGPSMAHWPSSVPQASGTLRPAPQPALPLPNPPGTPTFGTYGGSFWVTQTTVSSLPTTLPVLSAGVQPPPSTLQLHAPLQPLQRSYSLPQIGRAVVSTSVSAAALPAPTTDAPTRHPDPRPMQPVSLTDEASEKLQAMKLREQQLIVQRLREEQQQHFRAEQERERVEQEKRRLERERLHQEEEKKRQEMMRKEQEKLQEELRRQEQMMLAFLVRQQEQEKLRQEQELRRLEALRQQEELARKEELQRRQEEEEQRALEALRRQEELEAKRREEEERRRRQEEARQEELRKNQLRIEEELKRKQEEERLQQQRLAEQLLMERRRQEELAIRMQQEEMRREQHRLEQLKLEVLRQEQLQAEQEKKRQELLQQEKLKLQLERERQEMQRLVQQKLDQERQREELLRKEEEKREQEQRAQEALRMEQERQLQLGKLRAEKELLAKRMAEQRERLRTEQEEIQKAKESMARECDLEQMKIQRERQILREEQEKLHLDQMEKEERLLQQEILRRQQEQLFREQLQQLAKRHNNQEQERLPIRDPQANVNPPRVKDDFSSPPDIGNDTGTQSLVQEDNRLQTLDSWVAFSPARTPKGPGSFTLVSSDEEIRNSIRLASPPPPLKTRRAKGTQRNIPEKITPGSADDRELNAIFDSSDFDRALVKGEQEKSPTKMEKIPSTHRDITRHTGNVSPPDIRKAAPTPSNPPARGDESMTTNMMPVNKGSNSLSPKVLKCPICGQDFESLRVLGPHIDDKHPALLTSTEESKKEDQPPRHLQAIVADKSPEHERTEERKEKIGTREKLRGFISGISSASKESSGTKSTKSKSTRSSTVKKPTPIPVPSTAEGKQPRRRSWGDLNPNFVDEGDEPPQKALRDPQESPVVQHERTQQSPQGLPPPSATPPHASAAPLPANPRKLDPVHSKSIPSFPPRPLPPVYHPKRTPLSPPQVAPVSAPVDTARGTEQIGHNATPARNRSPDSMAIRGRRHASLSPDAAATIVQSRWRGILARRAYADVVLRTRVVREILSSEHIYVSNLRVLIEVFLQPLRRAAESGKSIIPTEDIRCIFSNLEDIYAYNAQLLEKLDARVSSWSVESLIGDIFLDMKGDFVHLYSSFTNHYDDALNAVIRCRNSKGFDAFLRRCHQHPECGGLHLESFLILPIQRVPRYVILLRDLLKRTNLGHVDYENIKAAHEYMDNICKAVNENKRYADNLKKQMDLLSSLQTKIRPKEAVKDLVEPSRVLLHQGQLVHYDQYSDKRKDVCVFLFNDLLLLTKVLKKGRYKLTAKILLKENVRLEIMPDNNNFLGQEIKNAFVLHTPRISYLLFCSTVEERTEICSKIANSVRLAEL